MKRNLSLLAAGRSTCWSSAAEFSAPASPATRPCAGFSVAIVDKGDFASGTSSRSSKLIHGGFRYLEQREFALVRESCRERDILRRIAPHLVKAALLSAAGVRDEQALDAHAEAGDDAVRHPRAVSQPRAAPEAEREGGTRQESSLDAKGLRGAIRFFDCQEDDARFCIENILHAADRGATCANYCEVIGFDTKGARIRAARLIDRIGNAGEFEIARARLRQRRGAVGAARRAARRRDGC
jgi:glycerol-3-phosphate dehydrogenase